MKVASNTNNYPKMEIVSVGKLPFDKFVIPTYQRPYKWTAKNVNQLISDIIAFRNKKRYRLGTLVLNNNEIVDGQQRIITLVLLLLKMIDSIEDKNVRNTYNNILNKITGFSSNVKFINKDSTCNIVENIHTIENRKMDFGDDVDLLDFILEKCEFVVIELDDISEAFQFFDSQNARGKDLEPHDLLKAYHLREIPALSNTDSKNISEWQDLPTETLQNIFLTLFRAKCWSKGKSAKSFSKNDINIFKGISVNGNKRYPYYQMEVIAHIFSSLYNNDPTRIIDGNHIEYPFNLDDQIINGSRFFDMISHYTKLYQRITSADFVNSLNPNGNAKTIFGIINDYPGKDRIGDNYIRDMFDTLLLYYIDRFGEEELDKIIPQFFVWAYRKRLESHAIQLATVDNYACEIDSMFKHINNAQTPYDIINIHIEGVRKEVCACTKCDEIIELFKKYNKYYGDGR